MGRTIVHATLPKSAAASLKFRYAVLGCGDLSHLGLLFHQFDDSIELSSCLRVAGGCAGEAIAC